MEQEGQIRRRVFCNVLEYKLINSTNQVIDGAEEHKVKIIYDHQETSQENIVKKRIVDFAKLLSENQRRCCRSH